MIVYKNNEKNNNYFFDKDYINQSKNSESEKESNEIIQNNN
jgi:hypothetical protein